MAPLEMDVGEHWSPSKANGQKKGDDNCGFLLPMEECLLLLSKNASP